MGFVGGVICSVGLFALNQPPVYTRLEWAPLFRISEPYLYFSIWAFVAALTLIIAVSFFTTPEPEEKIRDFIYRRRERKHTA